MTTTVKLKCASFLPSSVDSMPTNANFGFRRGKKEKGEGRCVVQEQYVRWQLVGHSIEYLRKFSIWVFLPALRLLLWSVPPSFLLQSIPCRPMPISDLDERKRKRDRRSCCSRAIREVATSGPELWMFKTIFYLSYFSILLLHNI